MWVAFVGSASYSAEFLKAGLPTSGTHTLLPNAVLSGVTSPGRLAFDPPPYNLPISQH